MSEPIYLKTTESYAVREANNDKERLQALNITSPNVHDQFKLKINKHTVMYFSNVDKRASFIAKYYNRNTKRFNFETQTI